MPRYVVQLNNCEFIRLPGRTLCPFLARIDFQTSKNTHLVSWEESAVGPANAVQWKAKCKVSGEVKGVGVGHKKSIAKEEALDRLWRLWLNLA
ncbi:hypothetical protein A0H81_02210 [Grifola frondosa]|uniref:DRBM domain-containing protein n=1 Tax=Grifola frondosa TaxID=5627 RepID=A0A1C7ML45_GRIFR|nr:hypothetical protein A0H81_02210 [Grifola frondosa]